MFKLDSFENEASNEKILFFFFPPPTHRSMPNHPPQSVIHGSQRAPYILPDKIENLDTEVN